jgi:hypothetical protein
MATEKTVPEQLTPWEPGQSGNPAGRPKGSRNKLGEAFISALHDDFVEHGPETIARVRVEDPTQYVKVCASLLPKELRVSSDVDLTDEQLNHRIHQLAAALQLELGPEAGTGETLTGAQTPGGYH